MKGKKHIVILISILVVVAVLSVGMVIFGSYYLRFVPKITAPETVHADIGATLSIDELVEVERAVSVMVLPGIKKCDDDSKGVTDAYVSAGGQSVYAGCYVGKFQVTVRAVGKYGVIREKKVVIQTFIVD